MDDRHAVREGMINAGVGDWSSKWGIAQRRNSNEGMRLPIAEGRIAPVGRPEAAGGCVKRKAFTRGWADGDRARKKGEEIIRIPGEAEDGPAFRAGPREE